VKALVAAHLLPISQPPIKDGALVIDDAKIVAIGERQKILSKYPNAAVEDFSHCILMPGLVNAHTHLELLFDEETGQTPQFLDTLLARWKYRERLSPTDRRRAIEEGVRQLLLSGTTSVGDVGNYVGVVPNTLQSPMRMVLFPELSVGKESPADAYQAVLSQVDEILEAKSPRIHAGIAPYSAYTLSRPLLKILARQARDLKIPLKIHAAESFAEMQLFYEASGEIVEKLFPAIGWEEVSPPALRKTPIQHLESIGFLEGKPTLVGCNHLAEPDIAILKRTGTKVIHSPRSNALFKLGAPPIEKLRKAKVPIGIGTDGNISRHSLSLWDEMRYLQDHSTKDSHPSADDLLQMATLEGARALGLEEKVGSLEPGKEADLIAVRLPKEKTPKDLPKWLVSNVTPQEITAVYIAGQKIKR